MDDEKDCTQEGTQEETQSSEVTDCVEEAFRKASIAKAMYDRREQRR